MQRRRTPVEAPRGAPSQSLRPPLQNSPGSGARRVPRNGNPAKTQASSAIQLTPVQQMEAKAARDAVLRAMAKSSPQTAKKFVESISLDIDVETTRQLLLSKKGFAALPSPIGTLCRQLWKLDVSGNDLTDLSPLSTLQHLSNLNVAHNRRLVSLKGLSGTCLSVLNISFCAVESLEGLEHTALTLRTLIANDNRLQLRSPLLDAVAVAGAEAAVDVEALREHLPESLRKSDGNRDAGLHAVARRNYAIFSTFQECETIVLSRNKHLCEHFPTWSAEEVAAACGEVPDRASAAAGDEASGEVANDTTPMPAGGDDDSENGEETCRAPTAQRRIHGEKTSPSAGRSASTSTAGARDALDDSPEMATYKERRRALAMAHPLSVFERLSRLRKLSLSGCDLHSLPARWFLPMLTELRLAQNYLTSLQPDGVILRSLHILDISNNLFASVVSLRRCRYLEQLNVRGNPLIEEGAAQDKTAGLVMNEPISYLTVTTPSSGTGAVPIAVQQRVRRFFPNMKLLDGQPLMTVEQVRAAYKQGSAQLLAKEATSAERSDRDGPHVVDTAHETHDAVSDAPADPDDSEGGSANGDASNLKATARATMRSPARKARRVDPAVIAAEADEMDVVVEAPASVVKVAHAPIVRRERVLLRPGATSAADNNATAAGQKRKGSKAPRSPAAVVCGQAAVAKLLQQSRIKTAW
ncbi:hypothetical protein LSCM1_06374 [Leishmania martiniquensis]|uniref:Leucine-rich repeat protein n=1 Tax=Leishmania martiniquensis TaxID=1580590 RepID=A0A836H9B3_9TRYP|nr:hypothetical protein LSCM1_06374 [Leishmania martiniquensis]